MFSDADVIAVVYCDEVICDLCNADYTDSPEEGGLQSGSYACCPACAPGVIATARATGDYDRLVLNKPGQTFADFVHALRREAGWL